MLEFHGMVDGDVVIAVEDITEHTKPEGYFDVIEESPNEYKAGKFHWKPLSITFKNTDFFMRFVGKQIQRQLKVYNYEKIDDPTTLGKLYKFDLTNDEWEINGCWFGNIKYDDEHGIKCTILFDNATMK